MHIEPYLYFNGRCEEALTFYRDAIGAEISAMTRFDDAPVATPPGGDGRRVMHARLRIGDSALLASDGQSREAADFRGFSLSLTAAADREAERLFAALADGGQALLPMSSTAFASRFGMVADRFGVHWTIAAYPKSAAD